MGHRLVPSRNHLTAAAEAPADEVKAAPSGERVLRVVTQRAEPFVIYQDNRYKGFSIDLWDTIAKDIGLTYEIYGVTTIAKLLDDVQRGAADVAVSGIGITSEREQALYFSHSFFETGLRSWFRLGLCRCLVKSSTEL